MIHYIICNILALVNVKKCHNFSLRGGNFMLFGRFPGILLLPGWLQGAEMAYSPA